MFSFSAPRCWLLLAFCTLVEHSIGAQTAHAASQTLPIVFEANHGQIDDRYKYRFHRDGADTYFSDSGIDFVLRGDVQHTVHVDFVGGNAAPEGRGLLAGHTHYLLGSQSSQWVRNVPLFSELKYFSLYKGISLSFYGNERELEHDFEVAPGADSSQIALRFRGSSSVKLLPDGDLAVEASAGRLVLHKPVAYQVAGDTRQSVKANFRLLDNGEIRFDLGAYDHSRTLVIDPVIVFATYLAGTGTDQITAVTTDAAGNILLTGFTSSTDFPSKSPLQAAPGGKGATNAFITKLDPTGKTLIYSTYLGGSSSTFGDFGGTIAADAAGNAVVGGVSSSNDFPRAGAVPVTDCAINHNCYFVASLSPDGSTLNYAGRIGGSQGDYTNGVNGRIAVDASGNAYLAGVTNDPNFTVTPGTLASGALGYPYSQTFVLKVDPTGKLLYSTIIPGNAPANPAAVYDNEFLPTGINVDSAGRVTLAAWGGLGLPTTPGVVAPQFPNAYANVASPSAGVVLRLNATASAIDFASYLPGTDTVGALTGDPSGNMWITGSTGETTLPVSANAYQKAPTVASDSGSGPYSGYIMKIAPDATSVLAATYLDGSGKGQTYELSTFSAIAVDSKSNVLVGGSTSSADFPLVNPLVTELTFSGTNSGLVLAEMNPDLSAVKFGSFLNAVDGSLVGSYFGGMALDLQGNLIAAGATFASTFPTTPGSFEPALPPRADPLTGPLHSFVAKINLATPAPAVCFDKFSIGFGSVNANTSHTEVVQVTNCGNAPLTINSVTSSDPTVVATQSCGSIASNSVCPVQVVFTPVSSAATGGSFTLSSNATTLPQTVSFSGQGLAPRITTSANPFSAGHYLVGTRAPTISIVISNQGQLPLSVSNVAVSGAGFSLMSEDCTQTSIPFSCTIAVAFTPPGSGALAGTVVIMSNDPQTPRFTVALNGTGDAIYGVPSLSSISATTVPLKTEITETLTGTDFYPQSVVRLNGTSLTTSFLSGTTLKATIPAGALTALGEQILDVVNAQPAGGTSDGVILTPYQTIGITPSALVSVPATGLLYAAIPASATSNPNTVIPIDPTTGATQTPIPVGKNPVYLAVSSDGSYLFVANQADLTVQRIRLATGAVERTFPYTLNVCPNCSYGLASDLATVPGAPEEVLLAQGSSLTLYNDAGAVNHVPNDGICCYADPDFSSIAVAGNPLGVYGLPFVLTGEFFQAAGLAPSGLSYTRTMETNHGGNNTTGNQVISDGTLLYTSSGQIWDPATRTQVASFPLATFNATSYPNTHNITLDIALGEFYGIGDQTTENGDSAALTTYGLKSHAVDATLYFSQVQTSSEKDLVRWGTNGFAFVADAGIYLLRTSAVAASTLNPVPVLGSISPTSAIAGGAALNLTANGSSFLASSIIKWNGTPLPTSVISGQQLTAVIPASDLALAGIAQVSIYTPGPGGGSSASIALQIAAPSASVSLSASALTFPSVATGIPSSAQQVQVTNTGNTSVTVSGVAASGDFSETNTCGSTIATGASCTVDITFTPTVGGVRTGTLTIADSAPASPQTVTLTGTGVADLALGVSDGGSTSTNVTSGTAATYNLAVAGGTGFSGTAKLSCSGAPQYATCSVSPETVTVTSGTTSNFVVTVTTGQTVSSASSIRSVSVAALVFAPLFGIGLLLCRRRTSLASMSLCMVLAVLSFYSSGCGSGHSGGSTPTNPVSPGRTPAGTYTLTITATSGTVVSTETLTLIVQ